MCLLTPQQETKMARPRPVFRAWSAFTPPGFGCARLATLAFAPPHPGGVKAQGRKTIYRKTFTPPVIYVQAKRWQDTVGRKEIQSFVGALAGKKAQKGVFITTSGFKNTATDYAKDVHQKVILIDGERLADLMIEHNIGVSPFHSYEIKHIDSDYFEQD